MHATPVAAAELMNTVYRYQRHIYDATRKPYLLGRDTLINQLQVDDGGRVLEIGCGTARNLIVAARRFPKARFFGIDVSSVMLEKADAAVRRQGLGKRIVLAHADAATLDPDALLGESAFDRIFISYAVSMIGPWQRVIEDALSHLAPGGRLVIVDFGDQAGLPRAFKVALYAWLTRFHVTPRQNLREVLEALSLKHGCQLEFQRLYGSYAFLATLHRQGDGVLEHPAAYVTTRKCESRCVATLQALGQARA